LELTELIGYLAAIVGTIIFIPQAFQTIKTKNTKSLSLPTFILLSLNNSLWLTYGILLPNNQIILSQVIVSPLTIIIIIYKIKYG